MAIPSATITLSNNVLTISTNSTVIITFSEAVSGFTTADLVTPNATLGTMSTTDNISFVVVMTAAANVLDNSNTVVLTAGSYISVSTSEAGTGTSSANYTVNTVTTSISVNAVTEGDTSVTGAGAFDEFMKAIVAHLTVEYEANRITSDKYPDVYLGAMQTALTQAVMFVLQAPLVEKQTDSESAKKALIERQTKGFDDDAKQKLLKQMLDSWSVAYSVAKDANSIPDTIKVNPIDSVAKNAMDSLAIVKSNNPLAEA